jgi:hypothetical protein
MTGHAPRGTLCVVGVYCLVLTTAAYPPLILATAPLGLALLRRAGRHARAHRELCRQLARQVAMARHAALMRRW